MKPLTVIDEAVRLRVLIIEDSEDDALLLVRHLRQGGYEPVQLRVDTPHDTQVALRDYEWDLVITDHNMPNYNSSDALALIAATGLDLPVIVVSGSIGEEIAVDTMKAGAHDYVMKGHLARLVPAIERELREAEGRRAHRRAEETIRHMAFHDALTGLINRTEFELRVRRALESARNYGTSHALLFIDLDQFKIVNDTSGHLAGDEMLKRLTRLLLTKVRGSDTLARLGGDEFAVLLYDVDRAQASAVADAYRRQLADFIFRSEGGLVDVGCSIGVAMLDADIKTKEDLLSRADVACHIAKRAGKNRIHLFEPHDQENVDTMSADMGWARRIKDCMELDRFVLTSQPIVDILTGKVSSYELLLRMPDDSGGLVMPSGFLPAAERFGLSGEVDHWVVRAALREVRASSLDNPVNYSVNLSAKSIGDKSLLKLIRRELENHEMDARRVVFEVTETGAIANLHAAALFLQELRGMGFRTALDDFGVGYSSFAYLKDLPVDYVKIDGSFVQGVTQDKVKQAIVKAMNDVAHALGKQTVAEFVEDQATLDFLKEARIDFCQGYVLGRPQRLVDRQATAPAAP